MTSTRTTHWTLLRGRSTTGFTLAEVLLSLALLSGLAAAIASWTVATARAVTNVTSPIAWQTAAHAVLDRIGRDQVVGDFGIELENPRKPEADPRVAVHDEVLTVRTREDGPCVRHYARNPDPQAEALEVRIESSRHPVWVRQLLRDVTAWHCDLDAKTQVLHVVLEGPGGLRAERSYRVR